MEQWRAVLDFEGLYEVSDQGRVKTVATGRIRKPSPCNDFGHLGLILCRDGGRYSRRIHALVLESFIGPRPFGLQACHAPDPDPANNRLENLRWDTARGNASDRAQKTHCPSGHEYTPENVYIRGNGTRMCRSCIKIRNQAKPRKGPRTKCKYGHDLTPDNVYLWGSGARRCKTCHRARSREQYASTTRL